jgi:hypothetical protein
MQLRRGKATDWHAMVRESLDSFASPHYLPGDVKPVDRIMIKRAESRSFRVGVY